MPNVRFYRADVYALSSFCPAENFRDRFNLGTISCNLVSWFHVQELVPEPNTRHWDER